MLISVVSCVRNANLWIEFLNTFMNMVERLYKPNIQFEYFVFENNSTDNTSSCIQTFFKQRSGTFSCQNLEKSSFYSGISVKRAKHMANIRNFAKSMHGELKSDYVLLVDADVVMLPKTILHMINTLERVPGAAMVTPFGICWESYTNSGCIHYYDCLASIPLSELTHENTGNTCLFRSCRRCIQWRNAHNVQIPDRCLFDTSQTIDMKSAFGSVALLRSAVYNKVDWSFTETNTVCEHHPFCQKIAQHGRIIIEPSIKTVTTSPQLRNYLEIYTFLQTQY